MGYADARQAVLSRLPKGAIGAEIGVWKGDFSAQILASATPARLHLVDPWAVAEGPGYAKAWYGSVRAPDMEQLYLGVKSRFATEIEKGQVLLHRGAFQDAAHHLGDDSLDFVYVDGDHSYEAVRKDLFLAVSKVRPGGLICADDHMLGRWWGDGVVRAVNDVLGAHSEQLQIVFATDAQVALQKRTILNSG